MYGNLFQPGEMIGGNEVLELLDRGGFSEIYRVRAPDGEILVLKVLDPRRVLSERDKARLLQEGRVLSMIEHINVVQFHGSGIHKERYVWILLEHVPGKNLREVILHHGGKPPIELAVRWVRQICEGVAEAHKIPAIHRDLKPENVVICPGDLAKVIDFGLAKLEVIGLRTATLEERCGTALYMSPEQFDHKSAHPTMDVYSIGMMLYEMLSGRHPMKNHPSEGEATMGEICARQTAHRPPPLAEMDPSIPGDLSAIVDQAIDKDPGQRIQTVRAMADRLHHALKALLLARRAAARKKMAEEKDKARDTPLLAAPRAEAPEEEAPPDSTGGFRPGQVLTAPLPAGLGLRRGGAEVAVTAPLPRSPMRSVSLPFVPAASVFPEGESAAEEEGEEDAKETPSQRGWVEIPSIRFAEAGLVWSDGLHGAAEVTIADPPGGEMGRASAGTLSPITEDACEQPRRRAAAGAMGEQGRSAAGWRPRLLRAAAVIAGLVIGGGVSYMTARNLLAAAPREAEIAATPRQGASPSSAAPVAVDAGEDSPTLLVRPDR
jgi:tRNA A-37 threonylcarbamoyl transferase component Bud32